MKFKVSVVRLEDEHVVHHRIAESKYNAKQVRKTLEWKYGVILYRIDVSPIHAEIKQ